MSNLQLIVTDAGLETSTVRRIVLKAKEGGPLRAFTPGATITVEIPQIGRRKYSLIETGKSPQGLSPLGLDPKRFEAPESYCLGVRLAEDSQGGSRFMHALQRGDVINASGPDNQFALSDGMHPVVLIAGGIGITPLLSKAAWMKAQGRPFRFVYAARSAHDFAFLDAVKALAGDHLQLHDDAASGGVLDIAALLHKVTAEEVVHICGPRPMLNAATQAARALGWPADKLRFELFYSLGGEKPPAQLTPVEPSSADRAAADGSFEIEIKSTGAVFRIPADKSIVDVLLEAGLDPLYDCNKGECGVCQVGVLAGEPDHKDFILSDTERAANQSMQICVSRSKSPRLVLDL